MSAKVYGDIEWGMSDEDGMYAQAFDFDFSMQERWIAGGTGNDESGATFNESASWTLAGFIKTSGTQMTTVLGSALTLVNSFDPTEYVDGYVSGGQTILSGAKQGSKNTDARTRDLSGTFKPWMGAPA